MRMKISGDPWLADLTPILETALDAVVVMREDGTIAGWNAVAETTFGWSQADAMGRQLSELIIPQRYREAHHKGLEKYLQTGEGPVLNRRIEISGLRSSGEEFEVELSITPTDVSGEGLFLGFLRDISERKAAEIALRQSEARLSATYDHALVGIAEIDREGRFLRSNQQFSVMTGYSAEELLTKTFLDITHPDDIARDRRMWDEQWSGARDEYTVEKRYIHKNGNIIWVELSASVVLGEDGDRAFGVRVLRDITDKKRAEEQQRLLINELNHRVKNMLTVVQGLAHQTFKAGGVSPDLLSMFEGRLGALASAQNLLMIQTWEATPIMSAAEAALRPFQTANARISLDGPEVLLTPSATVTLTLALHELATNAAKYGALSAGEGSVDVRWTVTDEKFNLTWRENGGPAVAKPSRSGFGTRLLQRAVAQDLGAAVALEFDPSGLECTISAPLARLTP